MTATFDQTATTTTGDKTSTLNSTALPPTSQQNKHIQFLIRNVDAGDTPVSTHTLVLNPETYEITTPTRSKTVQTLDGSYTDNFGLGTPLLRIMGHTGWKYVSKPDQPAMDGYQAFKDLDRNIFKKFYALKKEETAKGKSGNPNKYELHYVNTIDDEHYKLNILSFKLTRTNKRPLLFSYGMDCEVIYDYANPPVQNGKDTLNIKKDEESIIYKINSNIKSIETTTAKITSDIKNNDLIKGINATTEGIASVMGTIQQTIQGSSKNIGEALASVFSIVGGVANIMAKGTEIYFQSQEFLNNATAPTIDLVNQLKSNFYEIRCVLKEANIQSFLPKINLINADSYCGRTSGGNGSFLQNVENTFEYFNSSETKPITRMVELSPKAKEALDLIDGIDIITTDLSGNAVSTTPSDLPFDIYEELKNITEGVKINSDVDLAELTNSMEEKKEYYSVVEDTTSYDVLSGDTVPQIAGKMMSDETKWQDLVELNKLVHPYITADSFDFPQDLYLMAAVATGATTVYVDSISDVAVNSLLIIREGDNYDITLVSATETFTFKVTLASAVTHNYSMAAKVSLVDYVSFSMVTSASGNTITLTQNLTGVNRDDVIYIDDGGNDEYAQVQQVVDNIIYVYGSLDHIYTTSATINVYQRQNPNKIARVGSPLLIPTDLIKNTNSSATDEKVDYDDILGSDFILTDGQLVLSGSDLSVVSGTDNVLMQLRHRISTERGELVYHTDYGIDSPVGRKQTTALAKYFKDLISTSVCLDSRVSKVTLLDFLAEDDIIYVDISASLINAQTVSTRTYTRT